MINNIIAVNIKQGGGLVLLKLLLKELSKKNCSIKIHVDSNSDFSEFQKVNNFNFVKHTSLLSKLSLFFKKYNNSFYFGNIPPILKSQNSLLYFHHPLYMESNIYLIKNFHFKFLFIKIYLLFFLKNVDKVYVQTKTMHKKMKSVFDIEPILMPFFEIVKKNKMQKIYDFVYLSLPNPNKNFHRFIEALKIFEKKINKKISLALTIPQENTVLISKLKYFYNSKIDIINFGLVSKKKALEILNKSKISVFPSTHETFGLPLIECAQIGIPVIASDLDYVYDVIKPSMTFDPYNSNEIATKLILSLNSKIESSKLSTSNNLEKIINSLTKKY